MRLRRKVAALAITAAALGASAGVAEAHSFGAQGPAHTHVSCTPGVGQNGCVRYILANGAIKQAPFSLMNNTEYNYVLVWCSFQTSDGVWWGQFNSYGPFGNNANHTYCQNPKYSGVPWMVRT